MAQRDTTGRVTPARGKIIEEILSNVSSLKTFLDFICSILLRDILKQSLKKYCPGHIKSVRQSEGATTKSTESAEQCQPLCLSKGSNGAF